jgi:hypothetical protein
VFCCVAGSIKNADLPGERKRDSTVHNLLPAILFPFMLQRVLKTDFYEFHQFYISIPSFVAKLLSKPLLNGREFSKISYRVYYV